MTRAHGSGARYGHTADDKIADRRSVFWRLHHGRLDVRLAVVDAACCKVPEHGLDDNGVANVSQEQGDRERRAVNLDGLPRQVERHVCCRDRARRYSQPNSLCTTIDERKLDGMQAFIGRKLKIKGNMMLAMLTLSSESLTQMIPCHQESQREPHQCQTC